MRLSAPTGLVFVVALIVAVVAVLEAMGTISFVPLASVWIMALSLIHISEPTRPY